MKTYVVGGAVRDELLGRGVEDRDWVVVGAAPEEMAAAGFRPVGRDFPVFLHPQTHEEYALARTERKQGRGYRGFVVHAAPDVTLEEDLARRDLTINAMARAADGTLIDPFGGERDLRAGVLRHVGNAFVEDPLRVLRVARFAARYGFRVAETTEALMRGMVASGELDALVAERVWQELARGLCEVHPDRMFDVLARCGALGVLLPELSPVLDDPARRAWLDAALTRAVSAGAALAVRFALLAWPLEADGEARVAACCSRLRAPNEVESLARCVCRCRPGLTQAGVAPAAALLDTLKCTDALRRAGRFGQVLQVLRLADDALAPCAARLERALGAAMGVDAGAVAAAAGAPRQIAGAIDAARVRAIDAALGLPAG